MWPRAGYAKRSEFDHPRRQNRESSQLWKKPLAPSATAFNALLLYGGREENYTTIWEPHFERLESVSNVRGTKVIGVGWVVGSPHPRSGPTGQAAGGDCSGSGSRECDHCGVQSDEVAVGGRMNGPVGCGSRLWLCSHRFESRRGHLREASLAVGNGLQQSIWESQMDGGVGDRLDGGCHLSWHGVAMGG